MAVRVVRSLSAGLVTAGARSYKWWGGALWFFCFSYFYYTGGCQVFIWNYEVTWQRLMGLTRAAGYRGILSFGERRCRTGLRVGKGRLMPSSVVLTLRKPRRVKQPKVVVGQPPGPYLTAEMWATSLVFAFEP